MIYKEGLSTRNLKLFWKKKKKIQNFFSGIYKIQRGLRFLFTILPAEKSSFLFLFHKKGCDALQKHFMIFA